MAWDNPHGTLSADEIHRLKREAEIFAEAQRKMLRQEEARREREARDRKPEYNPKPYEKRQFAPRRPTIWDQIREQKLAEARAKEPTSEELYKQRMAQIVAKIVLSAEYGSERYIHNRYGEPTW